MPEREGLAAEEDRGESRTAWRLLRFIRDFVAAVASYVAIVAGGLVAVLTASSAVGYLPYSDRPGPGWFEPSFSASQVKFYLSWSVLLLKPLLVWGTAAFAYLRVLRLLGNPTILLRLVGGLWVSLFSLILAVAAGWYIAIAAFPVLMAGLLGAAWGAFVVPRFLGPVPVVRRGPVRWALICMMVALPPVSLYWALFAPRYSQSLEVSVVRVLPSDTPLLSGAAAKRLRPDQAALLESIIPRGELQSGTQRWTSSTQDTAEARMLIVVTVDLARETRLRVPKGTSVIYIQRENGWKMYPGTAPTLGQVVRLGPGAHGGEATLAMPSGDDTTSFSWPPPAR